MAAKTIIAKRKIRLDGFHKLTSAIALILFFAVAVSTARAQSNVLSVACAMAIMKRSTVAILVLMFISRIVIKALASFEEMNRGKT
jgi:hypothetical protein